MPPSAEVPIASADPAPTHGAAALALDLGLEPVQREALPIAPEPVVVEAFVNGAAAALEKAATEIPAARLRSLLQRGVEGYRELTLYLPEKLAQELSLHCLEHNIDMSRLVASAVERVLKGEPVLASAPARAPEPQRSTVAPASEGLLSVAARALLAELGEWVRSVWAARRRAASRAPASAAT